jgi:hypothetical protein
MDGQRTPKQFITLSPDEALAIDAPSRVRIYRHHGDKVRVEVEGILVVPRLRKLDTIPPDVDTTETT